MCGLRIDVVTDIALEADEYSIFYMDCSEFLAAGSKNVCWASRRV